MAGLMTETANGEPLRGPLEGVRVLDLSTGIAGPYCGKLLADYGAEVIKVETPTGDPTRRLGPFPAEGEGEAGALFLHLNTGKLGITLDLDRVEGIELLHRLLRQSDVVVESCNARERARLGLVGDDSGVVPSSTVLVSVTDFGDGGPYGPYAGDDLVHMALAGWMAVQGEADGPPLAAGGTYVSYLTGQYAALGAMLALTEVERGGTGQRVEVRSFEVAVACQLFDPTAWSYTGRVRGRKANRHDAPWCTMPTSDGYVAVASSALRSWDELWAIVFGPDAIPQGAASARDPQQRERNLQTLRELTRTKTKHELMDLAQTLGHLVGEVSNLDEVLHSPQLRARDYFVTVKHPTAGVLEHPGAPARLPRSPWRLRSPAPRLGEHNATVYGSRLGLDAERLDALNEQGVI